MNYFIIGNSKLIKEEIKKIKANEQNKNIEIVTFDLEDNTILKALESINTISFFNDKKMIIVTNINLLEDLKPLLNYLDNPTDNILILTAENIDEKTKLFKSLKEKTIFKNLNNIDYFNYVKQNLKDYKIDNLTINLLIDYTNKNIDILANEIEKLKLYKEDKIITRQDIIKVVKKYSKYSIFDFINSIAKKDKKQILSIYESISKEEDEIKLLAILASHFRLLNQIKIMSKTLKDEEITKKLSLHPYRLKILKEQDSLFSSNEILNQLKLLQEMDLKIKSGLIDKKIIFPIYLSKI